MIYGGNSSRYNRETLVARLLLVVSDSHGGFMNRLLIVEVLLLSTVPLCAQAQQPNTAKLKADAQKVVSIIKDRQEVSVLPNYQTRGADRPG